MSTLNLRSLIGKLNPVCRQALEAAAGLCLARTHYNIEVEHWLIKLLDVSNGDLPLVFKHFGVSEPRLRQDLNRSLDRLKTGNSRSPALSPHTVDLAREAWLMASLDFEVQVARSGHVLAALLGCGHILWQRQQMPSPRPLLRVPGEGARAGVATKYGHTPLLGNETLARLAVDISEEFEKIPAEELKKQFGDITAGSGEAAMESVPEGRSTGPMVKPSTGGKTPALDQFTIDLTERARQGKIDPVLGRDPEIRLIIDILTRRRQNNPILTGEAGVGKTAVIEGFAQRIADGDVPPALKDVALRTLDLGLLQAGANIKGEFENRLKGVIEEVKGSPRPIILFIDEAHTLIGAGGQAGQGDAANLLKPALARGELRTIAATTWAEYKKYFEKDAALARRFQVVKVEEPDEATAIRMMRGMVKTLEQHHNVRILDEAVAESVKLSMRYLAGRQLPDKSVSLLDTACARVAIGQSGTPPAIEDCRRRIDACAVATDILQREVGLGANHSEKIAELTSQRAAAEKEQSDLETRWKAETTLVKEIQKLRQKLEGTSSPSPSPGTPGEGRGEGISSSAKENHPHPNPLQFDVAHRRPEYRARGPEAEKLSPVDLAATQAQLAQLTGDLRQLQGENPLMQVCVDGQAVAAVISGWTGIPIGRMVSDQIRTVLHLKDKLKERIIGQDHALDAIAQAVRTSRANMTDPNKPVGVFLMVGSSGVGKTETAIALAELLYGGDQNMTVINMSEFKEEHKVSLLMGSPPGYVGYGEGGVLTEAVRRKPYSVLLLDEMEKAHPGVQDIFFQVFDKGRMKDGEGRDIDFKNTLIIMTSNACTDLIVKLSADPETRPDPAGLAEAMHPELMKTFKPAFLGRLNVIPYYPLADDVMRKIIELKLGSVARRIQQNYKATFSYSPAVVDSIASRCTEVHTGGRNIDNIINRTLLPELSAEFLARMAEGQSISSAQVSVCAEASAHFEYAVS